MAVTLFTPDYVIIASVMILPLGIGIYLAIKQRNASEDEYLLGGRNLHVLPVTLSLFVTFVSSTSLIGMPAETYSTGSEYLLACIGPTLSFIIGIFTVIPIMHPLKVTSIYEFLPEVDDTTVSSLSTKLDYEKSPTKMTVTLVTPDYLVIASVMVLPLGIGIYLAVKQRNASEDEYLLGGRNLHVLPVTLSLFVTFMSSTSLIGMPAETFSTGSEYLLACIGSSLSFLVGIFTVVPIMHPLKVTSMYEYFHLRFHSTALRLMVTTIGMFQKIVHMSIVLLAPALTIQTVAGLPFWVSVVIVGLIGVIYTSIGGIRGVVFVDVFQAGVIMVGILTVIIMGVIRIGGFQRTLDLAREGGRIQPITFNPDPTIRHTFWTLAIGGMFTLMGYTFDQSAVQRVCAVPTVAAARLVYIIDIFVVDFYVLCVCFMGIVAYSYLADKGCDPFQIETVKNRNQVTPYFVLELFKDLPGLSGLYVATIFSSALSTISSFINGLSANTIEDILGPCFRKYRVREARKVLIAKISAFFFGGICIGLVFLARVYPGTLIQIAISMLGSFGGPIVGVFFLGALTPWSNKIGAIIGLIISLVLTTLLSIATAFNGKQAGVVLPPPPGNSCHVFEFFNVTNITYMYNVTTPDEMTTILTTTEADEGVMAKLYSISYMYYGMIGFLLAFIPGLVISLITYKKTIRVTDERLLFPFVRRLWGIHKYNVVHKKEDNGLPERGGMAARPVEKEAVSLM